jgi:HEAT repeat protein
MGRLFWPLALAVTFLAGWAVGGVARKEPSAGQDADRPEVKVSRLQQQVSLLQSRLRARQDVSAARQPGMSKHDVVSAAAYAETTAPTGPVVAGAGTIEQTPVDGSPGSPAAESRSAPIDPASSRPASRGAIATAPTVETALDRFYRYLEAMNASGGRERWQQAREMVNDLRGMGDVAAQALMQVLASGNDSEERRTAARLLGTLQAAPSLPLLKDTIEREDDVLLRRAAASALRQLQTPESVPVMERILRDPGEDRFVRLSAAAGLAQSGRPAGVLGLAQIFEESNADGRGRESAFRALASLKDERPLPFMRQIVTSQAEPAYRLQAIRYLTAHGDQQALGALQVVMNAPKEQPSIRDAAAQAYTAINAK